MRSNSMKLTVAVLAAATALSLAACGPDNSDAAGGAAAATTPAGAAAAGGATAGGAATGGAGGTATSPAAAGGAAGAAGGATTAPSAGATGAAGGAAAGGAAAGGAAGLPKAATAVKVGQPATVEYIDKTFDMNNKLEITVTGYETGSIEDLKAAGVSTAGLEGRTLVYVSYTIKNLGDKKLSFSAPNSKFLVFDQEGKQGSFAGNSAKPLPKCAAPTFQGAGKGMEVKGCDVVSLPGKAPAALVAYTDNADRTKYQASWSK
ncbi:DUF4352 domain-containing protein [Kitasatospora sp. NBC_00085]|uniref:hypothetical protein n=1 Tax=unclassified Kitasatospora TaxID=2633591 RepID=UPI0032468F0F